MFLRNITYLSRADREHTSGRLTLLATNACMFISQSYITPTIILYIQAKGLASVPVSAVVNMWVDRKLNHV